MKKLLKFFLLKIVSVKQYLFLNKLRKKEIAPGFAYINKEHMLQILSRKKSFFFVQVGANDGVKNDPLHAYVKKFHWKGILVEPLPEFFERLKKNYQTAGGLIFENIGIGDKESEMSFYYLPSEYNDPEWLQQIGSFDRKAIEFNLENLSHLIPKIQERRIKAIPLTTLFEKHQVKSVDLLVVDAEGFEYKILSQLKNISIKPGVIFFEWGCMEKAELNDLIKVLKENGYIIYSCYSDLMAISKTILN